MFLDIGDSGISGDVEALETINRLGRYLDLPYQVSVIQLAFKLLNMAVEKEEENLRLAFIDSHDRIVSIINLRGKSPTPTESAVQAGA